VHRRTGRARSPTGCARTRSRLTVRPLARRQPAELPQGRKAARVSGLYRVRGGSFTSGRDDPTAPAGRRRADPSRPSDRARKEARGVRHLVARRVEVLGVPCLLSHL